MRIARTAAVAALAFAPALAGAQQQTDPEKKPADSRPAKIEKIEVTASPLGRGEADLAQPATVLGEEDLRRKRAGSLGDTLAGETGVQSSAFGPASGRPIIRGLDGPRIRVLENGLGTLDVSSVSPDHMVATESLNAEQIEILRGPASLLYGSGAIGGIVNVVSNLVPRTLPERLTGGVEARAGSANRERAGSFNVNGAAGSVAWHLDGFRRKTRDYEIPGPAVRDDPESPRARLPDSFLDSRGGGVGASLVGARGYGGLGLSRLESIYGIPSGEGSRIDLKQDRVEGAGELRDPLPFLERVRVRVARGDYRHHEIESSGEIATTFTSHGSEARFEARHRPIGAFTGTFGVQLQEQKLAALGEEAVIPRTRSRGTGAFLVEQMEAGAWTFDAGVRVEREKRDPEENVARRFSLVTPAVGIVWKFARDHRLALSATHAERAPSVDELYSNGEHAATATFDIGDPALRTEVSRNVDVTLRKVGGNLQWKVNVFANHFRDYVYAEVDEERVRRFRQADARFRGVEAEVTWRGDALGLRLFGDVVRAKLDDGTNLPRIAPARLGASLDATRGRWSGYASVIHGFEQKRTAPFETATPGYTRVDAEIALKLGGEAGQSTTFFVQGTNLLDETIRLHTSYLKDIAPLMGRSVIVGLRGDF